MHGHTSDLWQRYLERRGEPCCNQASFSVGPAGSTTSHHLALDLRSKVEASGGSFFSGVWLPDSPRPFDGFIDLVDGLAGRIQKDHPGLIAGFGRTLADLLPSLAKAASLDHASQLRSGLADFVFRGDHEGLAQFYWRRDAKPFLMEQLLRFTLDASSTLAGESGWPTVLWLEGVPSKDQDAQQLVSLLSSYGRTRPVLICVAGEPALGPAPSSPSLSDVALTLLEDTSAITRRALGCASVFALPFTAEDWRQVLPSELDFRPEHAMARLVERGFLRDMGRDRVALASLAIHRAVSEPLQANERERLHRVALPIEHDDAFAATVHAIGLRDQKALAAAALRALDRAWGFSAHSHAQWLAETYLNAGRVDEFTRDLLSAMIAYDAERFDQAELHLRRLIKGPPGRIDHTTLTRLRGNNAIFGLGDLARGRELLHSVVPRFEEIGSYREAAFACNSIAFTLFREGRLDEAIEMERHSLELFAKAPGRDSLLDTIVQLNTGRLYRQQGLLDQALELFESARASTGSDFTPYLLQLVRASLASLRLQREELSEALQELYACLEISRDFNGESVSSPVIGLLSEDLGRQPPGR